MYFLAEYKGGVYSITDLAFKSRPAAIYALEGMKIPIGFKYVLVYFPKMAEAMAA